MPLILRIGFLSGVPSREGRRRGLIPRSMERETGGVVGVADAQAAALMSTLYSNILSTETISGAAQL